MAGLQKNIQPGLGVIPKQTVLPSNQTQGAAVIAAALAQALPKSAGDGIIDLGDGLTKNEFPHPNTLVASIKSIHGTSAVNKTAYLFNENFFNPMPTDNGSGSNSIVRTYNDGFVGKWYERYMSVVNNGLGVKIYGFNISCKLTDGSDDPDGLAAVNMAILTYDGYGNPSPKPIDFSDAARATYFKDGLFTIKYPFMLNALSQLKLTLLGDTEQDHSIIISLRTTPYPEDAK